jgi:hypothetical protein
LLCTVDLFQICRAAISVAPSGGNRKIGQFRLQVDRQTKATFSTYEAAEDAGREIKKGHAVVRVAVYDTVECSDWIIELPDT